MWLNYEIEFSDFIKLNILTGRRFFHSLEVSISIILNEKIPNKNAYNLPKERWQEKLVHTTVWS